MMNAVVTTVIAPLFYRLLYMSANGLLVQPADLGAVSVFARGYGIGQ